MEAANEAMALITFVVADLLFYFRVVSSGVANIIKFTIYIVYLNLIPINNIIQAFVNNLVGINYFLIQLLIYLLIV